MLWTESLHWSNLYTMQHMRDDHIVMTRVTTQCMCGWYLERHSRSFTRLTNK